LREMVRLYAPSVERFISVHESELSASVVREVSRYLRLGTL
jgi:hypothetical protein